MTLKPFISRSNSRRDWYEWWIEDEDTGRELDHGGAGNDGVASNDAARALAVRERRLLEGPPTELVEVEIVV